MMSIPQALGVALQRFQAGSLQEAEQLLRQVLQADAKQVEALHLLGIIAVQTGRANLAVDYFRTALGLRPDFAVAHNNLGMALQAQGKLDEAMLCYQQAVRLRPDFAEAHSNLARTLHREGKLREAVQSYEQALRLRPESADWHFNLGIALLQQGKLGEAVGSLERAVHLRPDAAEGRLKLADALQMQGKLDEAVSSYQEALRLRSDLAEAHINLAIALHTQGKLAEAAASYQEALRIRPDAVGAMNPVAAVQLQGMLTETAANQALRQKPDSVDALLSLATGLQMQSKLDEAVGRYEEALRLRPDLAEAHNDLGNTLLPLGRAREAMVRYEQALRLKPDSPETHLGIAAALRDLGQISEASVHLDQALHLLPDFAEAHYNRGMFELLLGNLERGWAELEWRWRLKGRSVRPLPRWDGSSLAGKTILLHAEQGLGDTIQFIRYAALVKERGATVVVECQPALLGVLTGCPGIDRLVPEGCPVPECELQAGLFSLAGLFGTTLPSIPAKVPYLVADPARVNQWRKRLAGVSGSKVGICWQGSPYHKNDRQRSVPLAQFEPVAEVPGVRLVCLQKGLGHEQWDTLAGRWPTVNLPIQAEGPSPGWVETGALLSALDLVITVDTAVAHLAGALGVPVWVALPFAPDWRWLLGREDSPWYPSMRLFRQTQRGDWADVFQRIKDALPTRFVEEKKVR